MTNSVEPDQTAPICSGLSAAVVIGTLRDITLKVLIF